MEVKELLKKLLEFGKEQGFFTTNTLGKLEASCCQKSKIEVIDFDSTKLKHNEVFGLSDLSSCDALIIIPSYETIDFIEMKSILTFFKHYQKVSINYKIENFDFEKKISDSIQILNNIINQNQFKINGQDRSQLKRIKKNYIILVDLNWEEEPVNAILISLNALSSNSSDIHVSLKKAVDNVALNASANLQQPILMHCNSFEEYYN